jgi:hypothetical protein
MPKCDGRRFIDDIALPLKYTNPNLQMVSPLMGDWDGSGSNHYPHQGWDKNITDSTYIVTILRDPIERAVSFYSFSMVSLLKDKFGSNYKKIHLSKEEFIKYFEKEDILHNFYCKNFLHDVSSLQGRYLLYDNGALKNPENLKIIDDRIKRTNLFIKAENFKDSSMKNIGEKIAADIGCRIPVFPLKVNHKKDLWHTYTYPESKTLYSSLDDSDKEYLKKYFELDYYYYEKDNLFYV